MEQYLVDEGKVNFKYKERYKYLPAGEPIRSREFHPDGKMETMPWIYYCFKYCTELQPLYGEDIYFVMRKKYSRTYLFTIIEKIIEKEIEDDNARTVG